MMAIGPVMVGGDVIGVLCISIRKSEFFKGIVLMSCFCHVHKGVGDIKNTDRWWFIFKYLRTYVALLPLGQFREKDNQEGKK